MGKNLIEIACPLCKYYLNLEEKYADSRFCHKCETLYTPYLDQSIYDRDYKDKYVKHSLSETNKPIQKCRWNLVKKYKKEGYLLDIGCGTGAFLKESPEDFSSFGCDINYNCLQHCRQEGVKIIGNDLPNYSKKVDVITMFDVIEHYPDFKIIERVKRALKDDGYFIFCTPNFKKEYLEDLTNWRHYRPKGEHVFCLSENSVKTLAKLYGWIIEEINFDESQIRLPENNIATYVLRKNLT